ncbi:LPS assembly lipoprotein LptE [Paracoccus nototheniae]|uniref:LPS assembly lipoprotein LptE n=1 Tax=Paracoccus nototheniae TaxID=2489002 RepID=A0ABW4E209_9RHOB|nr:LPS assembly lipoprotein LptE [Paracoccus nototheniae]
MSSHSRRAILLGVLATLGLAACGLTPVYGPGGGGGKLFGKVRPRDPDTPIDFIFNRRLAERLGPEADATYDLDYRITAGAVAQAITPDEVTTRYSLNGTADFALTGPDGAVVAQGRVSSFTSYSTTGTTISTLAAEGDARERLALMLADQVVTRLLAAASGLPD